MGDLNSRMENQNLCRMILIKQKKESNRFNTWILTLIDIDNNNSSTLNNKIVDKNKEYDIRLEDVIRIKHKDENYIRLQMLDSEYARLIYRDEDYDPLYDGFGGGRLFYTEL